MAEFYIAHQNDLTRVAIVEHGRVESFDMDSPRLPETLFGGIYQGRVVDVLKSGNMAFVDIGLDRPGVLSLRERNFEPVNRGDSVLVQVARDQDPEDDKGPLLSRSITLPMGPLLYTPYVKGFQISKAMKDPSLVEELGLLVREDEGVVVRYWADEFPLLLLERALVYLRQEWDNIQHQTTVGCVYKAPDLFDKIVLRFVPGDTLVTDDAFIRQTLNARFEAAYLEGPEIEVTRELAFPDDVEDEWDGLMSPIVPIPGGGELVIEETRALIAVDINSGSSVADLHDINRRALKELFHQIRLRNLAGIIVVDLAGTVKQPKQLLQSAKALAKSDTLVHGISTLGLLEISRKKTGIPLNRKLAYIL